MVNSVLMPNAIAMVLLLVMLFSANSTSRNILLLDSKIFVAMLVCNFVQCTGEIVAYSIDGIVLPGFHALNLVVNSILFIVNIFFAMLWVVYADYKIYEDMNRIRNHIVIIMLPALVIVLMSVINLFTPVFFRITQENQYERTFLFFIPYLLTYLYLAYGTLFIYRNKGKSKRYVFLPAMVFMAPILIGSIIQFFFYGFSTVWIGVAIALVAVYINVQNEISYTDTLSGLYTRMYMYQYLVTAAGKSDSKKTIAGIMLDIDDFKIINDSYGHLVGDDAIRATGELLYSTLPNNHILARYGGDEFIILREIHTEDELKQTMEMIIEAERKFNEAGTKEYKLNFSKGCGIFRPGEDTVDSFVERMDKDMYENKKVRKQWDTQPNSLN